MFGSFGELELGVNSNKKIMFDDFTSSESSKWVKHDVSNIKSPSEFLKDENKEIKFSLVFRRDFGFEPWDELEKIRKIKENGFVETLVLGTKIIGKFYIEKIDIKYDFIDNKGGIWDIKIDLSLVEYSNENYNEPDKIENTEVRNRKGKLDYGTGDVK